MSSSTLPQLNYRYMMMVSRMGGSFVTGEEMKGVTPRGKAFRRLTDIEKAKRMHVIRNAVLGGILPK
ncbi:MAG: hypothetical protein ACRC8W_11265 [Plesiomonas shigelloides]